MKVSVVIPSYNEEDVIGECLESLARQTYKDMEVILVDDGSTDDTVKNAKLQMPNAKLLRQEHKGAGAARNLGVSHSKGEILVFVDSDMVFDKNFIRDLIQPILEKKAIGTFSKEEYLLNKDNIWARFLNLDRGFPSDRMHPQDYPDTQKVFRAILKSAFEKAGGFNPKAGYTDDQSLSGKLNVEAIVAPGAIFYHGNPGTLREVFMQACWMAKRKYKLGLIGVLIALLRVSLPISFIGGVGKALYFRAPLFLLFKLVKDWATFIGILEFYILQKVAK